MQKILFGLVLGLLTAVQPTHAVPAPAPWQITIVGSDRGVVFLTFSNEFTSAGYGISLDAAGPFTLTGTWGEGDNNTIIGGFTQFADGGTEAGIIKKGILRGNGKFIAKVQTTHGRQTFRAPVPAAVVDIGGSWNVEGRIHGHAFLESFTLTASPDKVGWFDLVGTGADIDGAYTLSGGILVTSDRHVAGYTINTYPSTTLQAVGVGKVNGKTKKLILRGKDQDGKPFVLRATRPTTK